MAINWWELSKYISIFNSCWGRGIPVFEFWTSAFFIFFSSFLPTDGVINFFLGFFHRFCFWPPFFQIFLYQPYTNRISI